MKRRFFFHYRKSTGQMTVHFGGQCIPCRDIKCMNAVETKRNKRQPFLVMQGFAENVVIKDGVVIIS